ncbi:MAG: metallophosphoesterase [Candidatus Xenobia bacterium]
MMPGLTIYHTNDLHDHRDVFTAVRALPRQEPHLLLDVGDSLRGSNTLFYRHEPIIEEMNACGYHAQAMGNREFHYLRGVLGMRQKARCFPLLAANLHDVRGRSDGLWQRSVVLTAGPWKIGLTAVTPIQYSADSFWLPLTGFRFDPYGEALAPVLKALRAECHVVLLLSHAGYREDQKLAPQLSGVDVILGGHSHTLLREPTVVSGIPIVQTGCYGRFIGRLSLRLSAAGACENVDYELLSREAIPCGNRPGGLAVSGTEVGRSHGPPIPDGMAGPGGHAG